MAHTEIISKPLVKEYLTILAKSYGIRPQQSETALKILFDKALYAECVFELMKKMGITNKLKVTCYPDQKFPQPNAAAFVSLPNPVPRFASRQFQQWVVPVAVKKSTTLNYATFIYSVAHELSHVVLHSTGHTLRESEIATDLFLVVAGFGEIMKNGKTVIAHNIFSTDVSSYGYIPDEYFTYALLEIKKMQKGKSIFRKMIDFFHRNKHQ